VICEQGKGPINWLTYSHCIIQTAWLNTRHTPHSF